MKTTPSLLHVERLGDTLVVTPQQDLCELDYGEIEEESREALQVLRDETVKHVVIDLGKTDYYGSTALGFFLKLWKRVRTRDGRLAFCNVSPHERDILRLTRLDNVWTICATRDEALAAVHEVQGG
jgi:anti-anti-sigma factor